jgi:misacylated tRNA(Ala) deacylase
MLELFRDDAYRVACDAQVTAAGEAGIVLDQTVFYPQGGGQAGDAGTLTTAAGLCIPIIDTRRDRQTGAIVHLPAPQAPTPAPGDRVSAQIDWTRRYRHMRFHTATHLLCALLPFPTNGCSITEHSARLDFATHAEAIDKDTVQAELDRLIASDAAVTTEWVEAADLDARPELVRTMSVAPPRGAGRIRLLRIEGIDLQACGGTHVRRVGELGAMRIAKVEKISATNRRVRLEWPST